MSTSRHVKDPIHDYIELDQRVCEFVDTRAFQRLRAIKQLGTSYYVWPGGQHNRFEHCLGVAHLARQQAEHLQAKQPELGITARDIKCVQLAGLCHDLGHGPWSHVWDSLFIPKAKKPEDAPWTHEQGSEMMFDYMIKEKGIIISAEDSEFVKALISGESTRCPNEKPFLFEIVANKRNGIDVDKFDYISRDAHCIGEKGNLSLSRLIKSARVIDNQICYDIKDANQLYELCYTRFSLHKRIYNHKTARAIEYMIVDGLLLAEPFLKIVDQIRHPEQYVYLTDDIMPTIEKTVIPGSPFHKELAPARAVFDRIRIRDLYKCVDFKVFAWEYKRILEEFITPEKIVEAAKALPTDTLQHEVETDEEMETDDPLAGDSLEASQVIVDLSTMHYGMKDKNPLHSIKFYAMKNNPDKASSAGPGDVSTLMPETFGEVMLRIYTKDARFFGMIQAGYRALLPTIPDLSQVKPPVDSVPPSQASTMMATPPPTTPQRTKAKPLHAASSFSNNEFTTVSPNFGVPASPSMQGINGGENTRPKGRAGEKPKSRGKPKSVAGVLPTLKRSREDDKDEGQPAKKKSG